MLPAAAQQTIAELNRCLTRVVEITATENKGLTPAEYEPMVGVAMPVNRNNIGMDPKAFPDFFTLHVEPGNHIQLAGKQVKRLRQFNYQVTNMRATRLEVAFVDGTKKLYGYDDLDTINTMMDILVHYAIPFNAHAVDSEVESFWNELPVREVYQMMPHTVPIYKELHDQQAHYLLPRVPEDKPLFILSAGCGDAADLQAIAIQNQQSDSPKTIHYAGFDINAHNIAAAKQHCPQGQFRQGSIANMTQIFKDLYQATFPEASSNNHTYNITIFSGILTRRVTQGTRHALRYCQQASRFSDFVVIMGMSSNLIEPRVAKAAGLTSRLTVQQTPLQRDNFFGGPPMIPRDPIYFYRHMTSEERTAYLLKRSQRRSRQQANNQLDLAMSANPLEDFNTLLTHAPDKLPAVEQVDLSWSYLPDDEVSSLLDLCRRYCPNLKRVIVHQTDTFVQAIKDFAIAHNMLAYLREDAPNADEVSVFSISAARRFKLFSENKGALPVSLLVDGTTVEMKGKLAP